jgi:hypothetical protein
VTRRPPFRIVLQPLLVDGLLGSSPTGEDWALFIDNELDHHEQVVTLWHETLHLLLFAAGIPEPHDEAEIDAIAYRLAQACPEILHLCRLVPRV